MLTKNKTRSKLKTTGFYFLGLVQNDSYEIFNYNSGASLAVETTEGKAGSKGIKALMQKSRKQNETQEQ